MRFYWPGNFILSARTDEEIIKTVEHFRSKGFPVELPSVEDPITDQTQIVAIHLLPVSVGNNYIDVNPTNDVTFQVHSNAYLDLRDQAMNYEGSLRGGLYQIKPRRDLSRLPPLEKLPNPKLGCYFFFPKDVMEGLRKYDWAKNTPEVVRGNIEREKLKHPNLGLNNTLARQIEKLRQEESNSN